MKELTALLIVIVILKELVPMPLPLKELSPLFLSFAALLGVLGLQRLRASSSQHKTSRRAVTRFDVELSSPRYPELDLCSTENKPLRSQLAKIATKNP